MAEKKAKSGKAGKPAKDAKPDDEGGGDAPKKKGGKKKLMIVAVAALVVTGGLGGGAYYMGLVHQFMGWERPNRSAILRIGKPILHLLPEIKVDLKVGTCNSPFLRATVQVQLSPGDLNKLVETQDLVMDGILTHLRDQERQNVVGKEGAERLRFDLVQIIDNVIRPAKVHTVLFKQFIVQ
ncbi:MAG: flagellar basal body-associated FliL family protein [Proteobacteria bacterium]|nr:flagellar basal body-associated FliL family protein [Pseudomonadota bacterium]